MTSSFLRLRGPVQLQCRALGMLHQEWCRPRSVHPLADFARCERLLRGHRL